MKKLGLKIRLILAVSLLTLLMLGIAFTGYIGMVHAESQLASTYSDQVLPLLGAKRVSDQYAVVIAGLCRRVAEGSLGWTEARQGVAAARNRADAAWKDVASSFASRDRNATELTGAMSRLSAAMDRLRDILQKEDLDALRTFVSADLPRAVEPVGTQLDLLGEALRTEVAEKIAANESDNGSLKIELLVATGVAAVIAITLGFALARLAQNLGRLVRQAQAAGLQVNTSVTEIATTAKEQQATATEIAATTSEIGATSKEISATAKELGRTMSEVAAGAEQSAVLAGSGHAGLARMEEMMRHVVEAAGTINAKLAVLNEKAGNINQVVTTITKVADQTNLLSLNAAIEAEKAGEYGRGFAVVATEIRRLADQTAIATYDIEQMVKEILSAVSASVMSMDKFSDEVRRGVDEVRKVSGQLTQIIEHVQAITPRFETVNEGMQAQAAGAQQISEALAQLTEAAQQTVDSLRQSNLAMEQLNGTARELHTSVEQLKT